jgi:hypothetical protein
MAVWLVKRNSTVPATPRTESVRLPFALPCAPNWHDSIAFYAALARSDRQAVTAMLAEKKVLMVRKNITFSMTPFGQTTAIFLNPDELHVQVCYVPSDIIRKIEAELTHR